MHHFGEEGGDLLLVRLGVFEVVDHLVELLRADLLRFGEHADLKLLADHAFDDAHFALFAQVNDRNRGTALARTAGTTGTVSVVLHVVGESVVDHVGEFVHIEAARRHVGGHEELRAVVAELLHREVALCLRQIAVQSLGAVAVADEMVGHFLRFETRAAEDDAVDARIVVDNALKGGIFVLCAHGIIDVVHVLCALVAAAHHDFAVIAEVVFGNALNVGPHGGREEERLVLRGDGRKDFVDAFGEAHVEHLVSFVEHHVAHRFESRGAAVNEVDESAGSGDNDLTALAELANLAFDAGAAVDGHHMQAVDVATVVFEIVGDLETEFAGGAENDDLCAAVVGIDVLQHGKSVSGGFTGAGLRQGDDILRRDGGRCGSVVGIFGAQEDGDHGSLYGSGLFVAYFGDGIEDLFLQAQFGECFQMKGCLCVVMFANECGGFIRQAAPPYQNGGTALCLVE